MCGIGGWLSVNGRVGEPELLRMREAMLHRGPDGAGLWVAPSRRAGLAFRRLAIVDLSADANQPMSNEDGTIRVVFNGEIYNHGELRRELLARGHRFRTDHSDTESIVHGFEEWGAGVVDRLDGMFAIAVWDETRERLFLARDRIGIKPLYFTWIPDGFLFASEIKALVQHSAVSPIPEPTAIWHYLSFLATPAPLTMFRGIFKMPAGHRAFVKPDGTLQAERYWDALPTAAGDEIRRLPPAAASDFVRKRTLELLDSAVSKRLMSDVPFGVFLSGGIDSSANVALMARQMGQPVRTFTVGFSDHEHLNELEHARAVARRFGTDHREVMVDERAMREYLPELFFSQDEPIADWVCIPLYFVSRLARQSGTNVVQVGEGSDEQFCGYRSYMAYLGMYRRAWQPFSLAPRLARSAVAAAARMLFGVSDRYDAYLDVVLRAGCDREPFWSGAHVFPEERKRRLIDRDRLETLAVPPALQDSGLLPTSWREPDTYEIVRSIFSRLDRAVPGHDILTRMIYSEFKLRLPELLLMRVDKIGMSVSIEPRVPFLDHRLVEFTMSVPMSMKVSPGNPKSLLKAALRGLIPDEVIDRPKMGFGAPMSQWLRGDFGHAVEAQIRSSRFFDRFPLDRLAILDMLDRHRRGAAERSLYIWTIFNAVAWYDRWVEGDTSSAVA